MLNKDAKVDFTCPNCKRKFSLNVRQMMANEGKCPYCHITIKSPDFKKDLERKINDIERAIKRNLKP